MCIYRQSWLFFNVAARERNMVGDGHDILLTPVGVLNGTWTGFVWNFLWNCRF